MRPTRVMNVANGDSNLAVQLAIFFVLGENCTKSGLVTILDSGRLCAKSREERKDIFVLSVSSGA